MGKGVPVKSNRMRGNTTGRKGTRLTGRGRPANSPGRRSRRGGKIGTSNNKTDVTLSRNPGTGPRNGTGTGIGRFIWGDERDWQVLESLERPARKDSKVPGVTSDV